VGSEQQPSAARLVGRYALYGKIASGGMATVHFGRLLGSVGFSRTVAIKRLHPHFTEDPDFVSMFLDEARLAARVRHPCVVPTLDVVATGGEIFLVMEFVQGETLSRILRKLGPRGERIPLPIVASIFSNVLHGLHAAHEAKSERGKALEIVHRDVSPHNVIIGVDGTARVLDFGVAKAIGRLQTTREGQIKGKLAYVAPEQLRSVDASRQTDVYAASVCLWEALTGKRMFEGASEAVIAGKILAGDLKPPSALVPDLPPALDPIVMRGLDRDPANRFATAREMASALEAAVPLAIPAVVGAWIEQTAAEAIAFQAAQLAEIENASSDVTVPAVDGDATVPSPPPRTEASSAEAARAEPREDSEPATREPMYSVSLSTIGTTPASADDAAEPARVAAFRFPRPPPMVLRLGGAAAAALLAVVLVIALRSPSAVTPRPAAAEATSTNVEPSPPTPATDGPLSFPSPASSPAPAEVPIAREGGSVQPASSASPPAVAPRARPAPRPPPPAPAPTPRHAPPAAPHGAVVFTNPG